MAFNNETNMIYRKNVHCNGPCFQFVYCKDMIHMYTWKHKESSPLWIVEKVGTILKITAMVCLPKKYCKVIIWHVYHKWIEEIY
jgi:hypothetical protein